MDEGGVIKVKELAKKLDISIIKAYQLIRERKIKSIRIGRAIRIPIEEYLKFLRSREI